MGHPREGEILAYWATRLGCDSAAFEGSATTVVLDRDRLFGCIDIFRRGTSSVVTVHPSLGEWVDAAVHQRSALGGIGLRDLVAHGGYGPLSGTRESHVFYLDPARLRATPAESVRALGEADEDAFDTFRRSCPAEDLAVAEMSLADAFVAGAFDGAALAGCASLIFRDERVADLSVLTSKSWRGRGLGRAVVAAACAWGLDRGAIVQYEAASTNAASQRLAESLGFERWAVQEFASVSVSPFSRR